MNTYSLAAGEVILPRVLGPAYNMMPRHTSWRSIAEHGELMVAFGGLPIKNSQVSPGGNTRHTQTRDMTHAREQGVRFINISPIREDAIDVLEAEWLAIRPNTDVALMLGVAHTLVEESLHDTQFLETYTVGFEAFSGYLRGVDDGIEKNADWAAGYNRDPRSPYNRFGQRNGCITHHDFAQLVANPPTSWRATFLDGYGAGGDAGSNRITRRGRGVWLQRSQQRGTTFRPSAVDPDESTEQSRIELHPGCAGGGFAPETR